MKVNLLLFFILVLFACQEKNPVVMEIQKDFSLSLKHSGDELATCMALDSGELVIFSKHESGYRISRVSKDNEIILEKNMGKSGDIQAERLIPIAHNEFFVVGAYNGAPA